MPKYSALPRELEGRPFAVAEGRRVGVGKHRIDGPDLDRPFHGVRTSVFAHASIEKRCHDYLPRLREGQMFSHITAARLWGLPVPTRFHAAELIDVASTRASRPRCRGVRGHRVHESSLRIVRIGAFPVADPESLWCALSTTLSVDDLVIMGDAIVFVPRYPDTDAPAIRPYSTPQRLAARIVSRRGAGKRKLVEALRLIRVGSASPMETRLRLLIIRSGLREPQLNVDILDARGSFVACGDLYYPEYRLLVEYDGDQHRTDTKTYERDQTRIADLHAIGVQVIRVRQAGYFRYPERTIGEITAAMDARGPAGPARLSRAIPSR
ncbi:endonuclease domain-containing protein [Subtercola sp. PAMC28395]|uniref:endonuclease domain-containing protein n=1 Tax=Subtercola sp. PAMC28395 TaxID=2846775 RepID=UPI001C0C2F4D|nr:DUF559 domain-containing protein [Subtercola sp. PAMC28395]QWT24794.1 endonuclease domain-containing protein [Subtercola sp. PAMC28395]